MVNFVITTGMNSDRLPKDVNALAIKAYEASNQNNPTLAAELLEKAVNLQPDVPALQFNLATAQAQMGNREAADQMYRQIHERFPEYLFGITEAARFAIQKQDFKQAHELLNGLMMRNKLHISEYLALIAANIELALAENRPDVARSWHALFVKAAPDNPLVAEYRDLIEMIK